MRRGSARGSSGPGIEQAFSACRRTYGTGVRTSNASRIWRSARTGRALKPAQPSGGLAALAYGDFRLVFGGLFVSNIGTWMQTYGLGWFVVQLAVSDGVPDRGPLYLGVVAASRGGSYFLASLVAGTIADRVDRRRLIILVQGLAGSLTLLLALLAFADRLGLVVLVLVSAILGLVTAFDPPSRQAMTPLLVPAPALASAIALFQGGMNLATVLGPLAGGVLIAAIGVPGLLLCNALSYLTVIAAMLALRPLPPDPERPRGSVARAMREGYLYIWRDPVIRPLFALLFAVSLLARPLTQLLPALAVNVLHAGALELSWLLGAAGAGALVGSLIATALARIRRRGVLVLGCGAASGVALLGLASQQSVLPAIVLVGLTCLLTQAYLTNHLTIYQERTPQHLQGRVVGASSALAQSSIAFGALALGSLGTAVGVDAALAAAGAAVILAAGFCLARFPSLRGIGGPADDRAVRLAP